MEILIVLSLIVLNGLFSMAEMAVVSSRKSRLEQLVKKGNINAAAALELSKSPNRFLSTVQIGITFIGIFAGAFGGERISNQLAPFIAKVPYIGEYSHGLSFFLVVTAITYLSLIIGELVPKRIALSHPEPIARALAIPMQTLARIASPLVSLLSFSTDFILKLLHIKPSTEPTVSEEEVKLLIQEGARIGIFNIAEKDIVERTLRLGDKKIAKLMTPIKEVIWLDIESSFKKIREIISENPHSHFPVCRESFDNMLGVVRTKDLLTNFLIEEEIDLEKFIQKPLYVPENTEPLKVLEFFKKSGIHMAFIVDEYGSMQGILSVTDILEEIVGEIPTLDEVEEEEIMQREDGSWFVDGLVTLDEFKDHFKIAKIPGEKSEEFHTIGGFVMSRLERVPVSGDTFEWGGYKFEVADMDGNRVDKIILKKK